jgi:hypothetical protein
MGLALNARASGLEKLPGAEETTSRAAIQPQRLTSTVLDFFSRFEIICGGLLLLLVAFAVYLPILPGSLIMDDLKLIEWDNPIVNGSAGPASIWFRADFPLSTLVLWLQWKAWGTSPLGYHVVNIALHAVSAFLIWRVLAQLRIRGAWLAVFLFAVHPVCVASVARIAEIKNTLSLPFFLVSVWAYLRYEEGLYGKLQTPKSKLQKSSEFQAPKNRSFAALYTLSIVAFIIALLAKTSVVMLPVVLLCCAAWQRRSIGMKDLVHTAPHFVLALGFGLMSAWFQKYQALGGELMASQSFGLKLATAAYVCWFYLGKALLPLNLNIIYASWNPGRSFLAIWLPASLLVFCFLIGWSFRKSWGRHLLFALALFVAILFPAMGFFDAQYLRNWQVSDHLQYAALAVPLALAASGILWLMEETKGLGADLSSIAGQEREGLRGAHQVRKQSVEP